MKSSRILGTGSYVPEQVWTNDDLSKLMDTSDEWIQQRTGIRQRHWVDQNSTTCSTDLALRASERAIANAGLQKSDIDCILMATLSPDHEFPGAACFLQAKLGLPGVPAIDVRQQCTGFIHGVAIADAFIKTGMYKHVLLVGAEVHSRGLQKNTEGRDISVLFGDGAGAVVLGESTGESRVLSAHLHADGVHARALWVQAPGLGNPGERYDPQRDAREYYPKMNGKDVFVNATRRMPEVLKEALDHNGLALEDIDLFVFHQANLRINEMVAKTLGIPDHKVHNTIHKFGNTTAATIPLGLHDAVQAGKIKPGMTIASAAFGSGYTWASMIIKW